MSIKSAKLTALLTGIMAQSTVFAAVTIQAPEELIMVSINGQNVKSGLFKGKKEYKVDAGPVNLNIRYQQYFEMHNGAFDIVKSDIFNVQTSELKDNQNYTLKLANAPKDNDEAKKFSQTPTIVIYDQNKKMVPHQSNVQMKPLSQFGGIFSREKSSEQVYNSHSTISEASKLTPVQNSKSAPLSIEEPTKAQPADMTVNSDQQLIQIWKKATKADRQKFLSWLAEQ